MASKNITALETRLAVRLFDRNTRRCVPTPAGRRLYERAVDVLSQLEEAAAELLDDASLVQGKLKVSMPPEFASKHMATRLPSFLERHPRLSLTLLLSNKVIDLVEEGVDLSVRFMRQFDAALPGRKLGVTRVVTVASPAYLSKHGTPRTPTELLNHRGIAFCSPEPWTSFPYAKGTEKGHLRLTPWLSASTTEMVYQSALGSQGIAVTTTMDAGDALRDGRLIHVMPQYELGALGVYLVYPHRRHLPHRVRALLNFLVECFGSNPDADPFIDGLFHP